LILGILLRTRWQIRFSVGINCRDSSFRISLSSEHKSNLTPELTGRERAANNIIREDDDERKAIERSGSMSC
jgi:hypothetical protein